MKDSAVEVILILSTYKDNITAKRWLKNPAAIDMILECHQDWNNDHEAIGETDMIFPLEVNIADYLNQPEKIDRYLTNEKEQLE